MQHDGAMNKILVVVGCFLSTYASGQIFEIQSSNGITIYSDRVPASIATTHYRSIEQRSKESRALDHTALPLPTPATKQNSQEATKD